MSKRKNQDFTFRDPSFAYLDDLATLNFNRGLLASLRQRREMMLEAGQVVEQLDEQIAATQARVNAISARIPRDRRQP